MLAFLSELFIEKVHEVGAASHCSSTFFMFLHRCLFSNDCRGTVILCQCYQLVSAPYGYDEFYCITHIQNDAGNVFLPTNTKMALHWCLMASHVTACWTP
jgi:hypothetical protein